MGSIGQDLRFAFRNLRRAPGFTAVAVLTLALGIGVNAAVFSILNGVLLRPLPFEQPQQLVKIWGKLEKAGIPQNWISEPEYWDLQEGARSFSALAAYSAQNGANFSLAGSAPQRVTFGAATASLFPLLGVKPALGRTFTAEEDEPGREQEAVVSFGFWKSQLGGSANVIGSTIQLDAKPYTVIGVLPRGFSFAGDNDLWRPIALDRSKPGSRGSHYLDVIARLKPAITMAQAGANLDAMAARMLRDYPRNYGPDRGWGLFMIPLQTEVVGEVRPALLVLFGAVLCVLLIACANLANLLLARGSARTREMAVRAALGAARGRLMRQLLTESALLGCVGGGAGILLASFLLEALQRYAGSTLPRASNIALDGRVLLFTAGVSLLAGIFFGFAPALQLSGTRALHDSLKEAGRGAATSTSAAQKLRNGFVVAEISLALVLVVCAVLLVRSLDKLLQVQPGFAPEHLLTARVALPKARYAEDAQSIAFFRELLQRAAALPGTKAVGAVNLLPLSGAYSSGTVSLEHPQVPTPFVSQQFGVSGIETDYRVATPGYFETMRIALRNGRVFTEADNENAPLVALVDEDFARRFWPTQDPIGKRIAVSTVPNSNPPVLQWRTIVGVVAHVNNYGLDSRGREQAYFPFAQAGGRFNTRALTVVLRASGDPAALTSSLRGTLAALDPELPLYQVRTMDEWLDQSMAQRRLNMVLLSGFGALALALALIGIYGVISYSVSQRVHEIGIRMALGASRGDVLKLVVGQGARLTLLGVAVGVALALTGTRLLTKLLFGVKPTDPLTLITVAVALPLVALLASYLPARRATRVDPMVALRNE